MGGKGGRNLPNIGHGDLDPFRVKSRVLASLLPVAVALREGRVLLLCWCWCWRSPELGGSRCCAARGREKECGPCEPPSPSFLAARG